MNRISILFRCLYSFVCVAFYLGLLAVPAHATCWSEYEVRLVDESCKALQQEPFPANKTLRVVFNVTTCCAAPCSSNMPGCKESCSDTLKPESITETGLVLLNQGTKATVEGSFVKNTSCADAWYYEFQGRLPGDATLQLMHSKQLLRSFKTGPGGVGCDTCKTDQSGVGCDTWPGQRAPSSLAWLCMLAIGWLCVRRRGAMHPK